MHSSDRVRVRAIGHSHADRVCEQGWGQGQGTGMGWGEHVVQARAREWEWRRVQGWRNDACVVVADWGWRRVGVEAWACTCSRWGEDDDVVIVVIFIGDEGTGPWARPVGPPR